MDAATTDRLREKGRPLKERLAQLRLRARRGVLVIGLSLLVLVMTVLALVSFAADWTLYLEQGTRAFMLGLTALLLVILGIRRILLPIRVPLSDDDLALAVEREYPDLRESLINAVQFSEYEFDPRHDISAEMMEAVEDQARTATAGLDFRSTLNAPRVRWRATVGILCFAALGTLAACFPGHARLWFSRTVLLSQEEWPRKTRFVVRGFEEGRIWVPKGGDLAVIAEAKGLVPRRVVIRYRYGSGGRQKATMHVLGRSEFKHEFHRILEPIQFHLRGGDGRTAPYTIEVVDRPSVEDIHLSARPPAYTKEPTRHFPKGHPEIRLPGGSDLLITGKATKEIVEATVMLGDVEHPAKLTGERSFALELKPEQSSSLRLVLKDSMGLDDARPFRLHVRIVKDQPPRLKLRLRGIGDMVTPAAVIPMTVHIQDDYGVNTADLLWRISSEDGESKIPLEEIEAGTRKTEILHRWELMPLSLPPEQFLSFHVDALDFDDVAGPNLGSSETFTLKVVTIEEFAIEMIRRQQEQRREMEMILKREKKDRETLQSLVDEPEPEDPGVVKILQALERSQRLATRQCEGVADRLRQILEEMLNNRIAEARHVRRIAGRVILPLRELAGEDLTETADRIGQQRAQREVSDVSLLKIVKDYDRIIAQMERILSNMGTIEQYTEIVARLRIILQDHTAAREGAEKAYKKKIEDIFKEF